MPDTASATPKQRIAPTAMRKNQVPIPLCDSDAEGSPQHRNWTLPASIRRRPPVDSYALTPDPVAFRDTIRRWCASASLRARPRSTPRRVPVGHPRAVRRARPVRPAVRRGARRDGYRHADAQRRDRGGRARVRLERADADVQELGTLPIQLFGTEELKQRFLPALRDRRMDARVRAVRARGRLRSPAGCHRAVQRRRRWVVNGAKNWITNLGVADFYVVFAKTDPSAAARAASARSSSRPIARASASASSSTSSASRARRPASRSSTTSGSPPRT